MPRQVKEGSMNRYILPACLPCLLNMATLVSMCVKINHGINACMSASNTHSMLASTHEATTSPSRQDPRAKKWALACVLPVNASGFIATRVGHMATAWLCRRILVAYKTEMGSTDDEFMSFFTCLPSGIASRCLCFFICLEYVLT